ncbi:MAG: hypothetical protein JWL77_3408 [Chthonomonadaceae bacterium]|nr:hypothetical protein [Chthonomonadaceae bacterium]
MSTQSPEKRSVGKAQYLRTMGMKAALYSAAISVVCFGLAAFVMNIFGTVQDAVRTAGSNEPETAIPLGRFTPNDHIYFLVLGAILSVICLAVIWFGKAMFKKAQKIEPVALIKKQSALPLPEAETLVRASGSPSTDHQELLRGARQGSETPVTELLRGSQQNR